MKYILTTPDMVMSETGKATATESANKNSGWWVISIGDKEILLHYDEIKNLYRLACLGDDTGIERAREPLDAPASTWGDFLGEPLRELCAQCEGREVAEPGT